MTFAVACIVLLLLGPSIAVGLLSALLDPMTWLMVLPSMLLVAVMFASRMAREFTRAESDLDSIEAEIAEIRRLARSHKGLAA